MVKVYLVSDYLVYGGNKSVLEYAYKLFKQKGYDDISIVMFKLSGFSDLLRNKFKFGVYNSCLDNKKAIICDTFAHVDCLRYTIPSKKISEIIKNENIVVVVGGGAISGYVLSKFKGKYICWISTSQKDEDLSIKYKRRNWKGCIYKTINRVLRCFYYKQEKYVLENAERVITHSVYSKEVIKKYIENQNVSYIPYGIDTDIFKPGDKTSKVRYILAVGRYRDTRKNLPMLLDVFCKIAVKKEDIAFKIIGRLYNKEDVYNRFRSIEAGNRIEIIENVDENKLVEYYQNAELFLLTSKQEGLGIVVLEAMACGVPIVATRCGGVEDMIADGHNGYLVGVGDVSGMTAKAIMLLDNKEQMSRFFAHGLETVKNKYAKEIIDGLLWKEIKDAYKL